MGGDPTACGPPIDIDQVRELHSSGISSQLLPAETSITGGGGGGGRVRSRRCPNQSPVCLIHSQTSAAACKSVLSWSGEAVVLQPAAVLSEDGDEEEDHDEERAEEEEGDDYEEDGDEEEDEV